MILSGDEIEIVIEYKKIKNIYFRINDQLQIHVTCPKYVSKREIRQLLDKNRNSLEKMYIKEKKKREENDKILYLGQEMDYVYYKKVMLEGNIAFGPSVDAVNKFLEDNCLEVFQKRMEVYISTFRNLPQFRLRTRKMKTRWGVCNRSSMTVTLNSLLIHKKVYLIDYVICHELSHFSHMDHSSAFWKCVEEHFPRYKEARRELKKE